MLDTSEVRYFFFFIWLTIAPTAQASFSKGLCAVTMTVFALLRPAPANAEDPKVSSIPERVAYQGLNGKVYYGYKTKIVSPTLSPADEKSRARVKNPTVKVNEKIDVEVRLWERQGRLKNITTWWHNKEHNFAIIVTSYGDGATAKDKEEIEEYIRSAIAYNERYNTRKPVITVVDATKTLQQTKLTANFSFELKGVPPGEYKMTTLEIDLGPVEPLPTIRVMPDETARPEWIYCSDGEYHMYWKGFHGTALPGKLLTWEREVIEPEQPRCATGSCPETNYGAVYGGPTGQPFVGNAPITGSISSYGTRGGFSAGGVTYQPGPQGQIYGSDGSRYVTDQHGGFQTNTGQRFSPDSRGVPQPR
jgi:hypothetical protein